MPRIPCAPTSSAACASVCQASLRTVGSVWEVTVSLLHCQFLFLCFVSVVSVD